MCLGPTTKLISELELDDESSESRFELLLRVVLGAANELEGPGQTDERK
jgi:hypothetical protein